MINPGEFDEKIKILALSRKDNTFQWNETSSMWAKAEPFNYDRPFSYRRSKVKSVKFTMRKCALTLNNAILWKGKHCFLTDITEIDRMYFEVIAVMLEPKTCIASKLKMSLNSLNRPVASAESKLTFPGLLVDTHSKKSQGKPMSVVELQYLLTVPKEIELRVGECVEIEGIYYEVWTPRRISDYRNEYEIRVRRDA